LIKAASLHILPTAMPNVRLQYWGDQASRLALIVNINNIKPLLQH
jgi:hypothetical protein